MEWLCSVLLLWHWINTSYYFHYCLKVWESAMGSRWPKPRIDSWPADSMLSSWGRLCGKERPEPIQAKYCQPPLLQAHMDEGHLGEVVWDEKWYALILDTVMDCLTKAHIHTELVSSLHSLVPANNKQRDRTCVSPSLLGASSWLLNKPITREQASSL